MSEQDKKGNLEKNIAILAGIIGLSSIIYFGICKFISLGRLEYFDFDMEYYEYSIHFISKGILFLYLTSFIIGVTFSVILVYVGLGLKKKFNNLKIVYELIYYLISIIIVILVILVFFVKIFGHGYGVSIGVLPSIMSV